MNSTVYTKTFASLQIFYMQKILQDSFERLLSVANGDDQVLSTGAWYAIDYYKACKRLKKMHLVQRFISECFVFHGYGAEDHLSHLQDLKSPTSLRMYSFKIKREKRPSEALSSLEKSLSLLDCGSVCFLATYLALCDYLGQEKFDHLFGSDSPYPFTLAGDHIPPLSYLLPRRLLQSEKDFQIGDVCYFSNCKEYVLKHPAGESRGFHVLCSADMPQKYLGFGLAPEGITREAIERNLWECFNEDPVDEGYYPEDLWKYFYSNTLLCDEEKSRELVSHYKDRKLSWQEYQNSPSRINSPRFPMEGKMGLWVYRPDLLRIEALVETSLSKVRKLFSSFSS